MRWSVVFLAALVAIIPSITVYADIIYVDDDAPGDPGPGDPAVSDPFENGSADHPYDAIQQGILAAADGDTVLVANGNYTGGVAPDPDRNQDLDTGGKAIIVSSESGPENCIINPSYLGRAFIFNHNEDNDTVINGLKFTECLASGVEQNGGAILCMDTSPTITNCIFINNAADYIGGAIYSVLPFGSERSVIINNCYFEGNSSKSGGAMYFEKNFIITNCDFHSNDCIDDGGALSGFTSVVDNCTFFDNGAGSQGGALEVHSMLISNCMFVNNSAPNSVGGAITGSNNTIINCSIVGNTSLSGGAVRSSNELWPSSIVNCIIKDNSEDQLIGYNNPVEYSCIEGGWPGTGNIDADPLFVTGPEGDYYLSQIASGQGVDSPCLNVGDPSSEMIYGTTRIDGYPDTDVIDMGYHYPSSAIQVIDVDVEDNFVAKTDQEERSIFQSIYDSVVATIPGSDPDNYTSTDVNISVSFSNTDLIASVSGHFEAMDNEFVIWPDREFELGDDGSYQYHCRVKNINNILVDVFSAIIAHNVPGTGGDLPPISFAAPTLMLESVTVELTTGASVTLDVNEVLPRFDVALGNQISVFKHAHLYSGFSSIGATHGTPGRSSGLDLLIENAQGQKLGTENGQSYFDIPYSIYSGDTEPEMVMVFGDDIYSTTIDATVAGTIDLTMNQNVVDSQSDGLEATFDNVGIQDVSTGWIDVGLGLDESEYLLEMDYSGSGSVEEVLDPTTITSDIMAYFTADTTQGYYPLTVQFTDQSLGDPVSWQWDIDNDGSVDYTDQNPIHTYNQPGTYTVALSVTDGGGLSNTETKTDFITANCSFIAASNDNPWSIEVVNTMQDIDSLGFDVHYNGSQRAYQGFYTAGCLTIGWSTFECEELGCVGDDCTLRISGSNVTPIPAGSTGYLVHLFFEDLDGQASQICLDTFIDDIGQYETDCGSICGDNLPVQPLISADMTCTPPSGTVPFDANFAVSLNNLDGWRPASRISAHIDVSLANGQSYSNWRSGWTNVSAGSSFSTAWNQNIPSIGSVVGDNIFSLVGEDVTPAPWNQPPYPPSGSTDTSSCTVTGIAP